MTALVTPLGRIYILIDGEKTPYIAKEGQKIEHLCPNLLGRYQIEIQVTPDDNKHVLACIIDCCQEIKRDIESGERLECQSFYNDDRVKLSIGLLGECWGYSRGELININNDYDIEYLENGMAYITLEETKTDKFTFGISWIDDVGFNDTLTSENQKRDTETWFGSDPELAL